MAARLEQAGHNLGGRSDAEIALHAFEEFAVRGIADLAGAYVGFIYDSQRHMGHLFTDRLGLRGCYYTVTTDGTFAFASEMKAIAATEGFSGRLDEQAAAEFLNCGFPFFQRTFFANIKYLPYGCVLTVRNGGLAFEQYWDMPRYPAGANWRFEDAVQEGTDLLLRAIGRQFRQRCRVGAMLSGGLDSRAIVAGAARLGHRVPTFSLGEGRNAEQPLAAAVAQRLGIPNHQLAIPSDYLADFGELGTWYADGMLPCRELHWIAQLDDIERECDSLLSGYVGGVFLGGVFLKSEDLDESAPARAGQRIAQRFVGPLSPYVRMSLKRDFAQRLEESLSESQREVAAFVGGRGVGNELERVYLATDERRLTNIGNAAMLGVIADLKYPFGDYDLLDYYAKLPVAWRFGSRIYKAILRTAFPELIDIPCYSANTRFLPTRLDRDPSALRLRWHRAMGQVRLAVRRMTAGRLSVRAPFDCTDYGHWYNNIPRLRKWITSLLLDEQTLARGYFDVDGIRAV
jgi:asparagine synthase (glutamine-hydrolysing)